jgi:two-component system sensor histidine kinase BarA
MEKPVDINLCLTLSHGKPALAAEILALFLNDLPLYCAEINQALDESRLTDAHNVIHKLHGACCYCGVPALKAICKEMERKIHREAKAPDPADRQSFNEAVNALLSWKAQHSIQECFT